MSVTTDTVGEGAEVLGSLADLFLLVAQYMLEGPDERLHGVLGDLEWAGTMEDAGLLSAGLEGRVLDLPGHRREWERRLRVPGDGYVPPYEQHYHRGKATVDFSAQAASERLFRRAGYSKAPYGDVQADHLGHQARFAGALMERLAACHEREDGEGAERVTTWLEGLVRDRCWWWGAFAETLAGATDCLQVRRLAGLVGRLPAAAVPPRTG